MLPPYTLSPSRAVCGIISPVSIRESTVVSPVVTTPSTGIRSPGFTTTVSRIFKSSGATLYSFPRTFFTATVGCISISLLITFLEYFISISSMIPANANSIMIRLPSVYLPIPTAPADAITIRIFSLKYCFFSMFLITCRNTVYPSKM